jgi:hypothetical protein
MEFLSGEIQVSSGDYSYQESLDAKLHKIVLQKGFDNYTVQIVTDNYSTYDNTFTYDSLLLYNSSPLIIEFQRNTGPECLGGSHLGDVVLLSQEDVDDFGKKCYTKIEGSLKIGNLSTNNPAPIKDLSPLETLRRITKDLLIIDNPDLTSLMGLQYLESVNGHVHLEKNERLESLKGLRRLSTIPSIQITANHSLTDLDGLQGLDISFNSLTISNKKPAQFKWNREIKNNPYLKDISALENIRSITRFLNISNNDQLTSINGLENLVSVGGPGNFFDKSHLSILNNKSLTDFCSLTNLFQQMIPMGWSIGSNAFNPTASDLLNGKCAP